MADEGGIPQLSDRLNLLFARVPRPGGAQPYSNDQAAQELGSAGISVTGTYLSQLRSGKRDNPSAKLLAGIAELFGVPLSYFFDTEQAAKIESQLDALAALRDTRIRGIVARSAGVSDAGISSLEAILYQIRQVEGLEDGEGPQGR